jgi:DUF4097 and DUF4098 domain-containing protein YvlB
MTLRRFGVLALLLLTGLTIEGAWRARQVGFGPAACHFFSGRFGGPSQEFVKEERRQVPETVSVIDVSGGMGDVRIQGVAGNEAAVHLRTRVYLGPEEAARAAELADLTRANVTEDGATLRVMVEQRPAERRAPDVGIETEVTVDVPRRLEVRVYGRHGGVWVEKVAAATVEGEHGDVQVNDVAHDVAITHRHGGVTVGRVGGATKVETRFGDAELTQLQGPLLLTGEHGRIQVEQAGAVTAHLQQARLSARDLRGPVTIDGEQNGVDLQGVAGDVDVSAKLRDVRVFDLGGNVHLKSEHGRVTVDRVGGELFVMHAHGDVETTEIAGATHVTMSHGNFNGRGLEEASIRLDGGDCDVENPAGNLTLDVQRGRALLRSTKPLAAPITASTHHGDLLLELSLPTALALDAEATGGEVHVSLPGYRATETTSAHTSGQVGEGGPAVRLRADRGDVRVSVLE